MMQHEFMIVVQFFLCFYLSHFNEINIQEKIHRLFTELLSTYGWSFQSLDRPQGELSSLDDDNMPKDSL